MQKNVSLFFLILTALVLTFSYQNCSQLEHEAVVPMSHIEYLPLYTNQMKLFDSKDNVSGCRSLHEVLYSELHNLCFEVQDSCSYAKLTQQGFKPIDLSIAKKAKPPANTTRDIYLASVNTSSKDNNEISFASLNGIENIVAEAEDDEDTETDLQALVRSCQIFIDINDLKSTDFLALTAEKVGYKAEPGVMCSMSIESFVNFKNRTCVLATNGCQSDYLMQTGFVKDYYSICPE